MQSVVVYLVLRVTLEHRVFVIFEFDHFQSFGGIKEQVYLAGDDIMALCGEERPFNVPDTHLPFPSHFYEFPAVPGEYPVNRLPLFGVPFVLPCLDPASGEYPVQVQDPQCGIFRTQAVDNLQAAVQAQPFE